MTDIIKELNALSESRANLTDSYMMNLKTIEDMQIDSLYEILSKGPIKLTKKDLSSHRLLFTSNDTAYYFAGIKTSLKEPKSFIIYGVAVGKYNSNDSLDSLLWDAFEKPIDTNCQNKALICMIINFLVDNVLIRDYKDFNVKITTECHIQARSLDEAKEMAYRTTTYDTEGNDITTRVVEVK